jgi:hypothetical protein
LAFIFKISQLKLIKFFYRQTQTREYAMKEGDRSLIQATWNVAKKNGNIAPKAFIRQLKLKPDEL